MQRLSPSIAIHSERWLQQPLFALNSPQRLQALYDTGLLDTPPETALDRLTELACRLLNASVALISLVDRDRQFFKSAQGLAEPWASLRGTPLSHSFCQYVVTADAPLIIADVREDPVLYTNLAIPDLHVIAYLGVPLRTPDGYGIGALCVLEDKPRAWSLVDIQTLTDLAELVMTEIAVRHSKQKQQTIQTEANFRSLFESMTLGVVYHDADGKITNANSAAQSILGLTLAEMQGRVSLDPRWRAAHADGSDFPGEEHPAMVALRTGVVQHNVVMYIFNPQQNESRCIRVDAIPQFREGEIRPYQVYVLFRDITEQRRTTEALTYHAHLLDNMHDAVIATDAEFLE